MKGKTILRSALSLLLLVAILLGGLYGVNGFTAPIVAENERRAAELAAEAEKALLGDSEPLFDRADPAASQLTVTADTVQSVYKDNEKQCYLLRLSTSEGYSKQPIVLTMTVDFDGRIQNLEINENPDDKELGEAYPQSYAGQDSTLAGVELVAGVTFTSAAIRAAVNDGFNTLIDNGLFAAAEKDAAQLLSELIPLVYPGIVNKAGVVQGEELEGSGNLSKGYLALNGSGVALMAEDGGEALLAIVTPFGGVSIYNTDGEDVTAAHDALQTEAAAFAADKLPDLSEAQMRSLGRMLGEGAELTPIVIPGLANCVTGAYTAETEEGLRYAFAARPYGYSNEIMELYYVLDEQGAIVSMRAKELILYGEYFTAYELDEDSYREGFQGLTLDSYTGEQALISGATMSSDAVDAATRDVFEAFALATENRG